MTHLDGGLDLKWFACDRTGLSSLNRSQICVGFDQDVSVHADMPEVVAVLVGAGHQILASFQK